MWRCRICAASSRRETQWFERWRLFSRLGPTFPFFVATGQSGGIAETLAERFASLPPVPIGSLLAPDAKRRPGQGREASWADRRLALHAGSKAAVVDPSQRGFYLAQQVGLTVHVANRQFPLRRVLNLVHLVRAFLDGDAVPLP